jgi:hypothetical protein
LGDNNGFSVKRFETLLSGGQRRDETAAPPVTLANWYGGSETIGAAKRGATENANTGSFHSRILAEVDRIPQRAWILEKSGCHRCLIESPTMRLPFKRVEIGDWPWHGRIRRSPFPWGMRAMVVEVGPEIEQLVFEIRRRPEQSVIQVLAPKGAD